VRRGKRERRAVKSTEDDQTWTKTKKKKRRGRKEEWGGNKSQPSQRAKTRRATWKREQKEFSKERGSPIQGERQKQEKNRCGGRTNELQKKRMLRTDEIRISPRNHFQEKTRDLEKKRGEKEQPDAKKKSKKDEKKQEKKKRIRKKN